MFLILQFLEIISFCLPLRNPILANNNWIILIEGTSFTANSESCFSILWCLKELSTATSLHLTFLGHLQNSRRAFAGQVTQLETPSLHPHIQSSFLPVTSFKSCPPAGAPGGPLPPACLSIKCRSKEWGPLACGCHVVIYILRRVQALLLTLLGVWQSLVLSSGGLITCLTPWWYQIARTPPFCALDCSFLNEIPNVWEQISWGKQM